MREQWVGAEKKLCTYCMKKRSEREREMLNIYIKVVTHKKNLIHKSLKMQQVGKKERGI